MRVLHVVTYISWDGAFGGPVAVALGQAVELARRGHEVQLIAGWDGKAVVHAPGVDVQLFPASALPVGGFSGLHARALLKHVTLHGHEFDVVHVHLARDLITSQATRRARRLGVPYVVQPHGMVMPDARFKSRVFDELWTKAALRDAFTAFSLTERETMGLLGVAGINVRVDRIPNGISPEPLPSGSARDSDRPEVLFLARLHPRKRVMAFAQMARLLSERGIAARFTVVGPDEGDLPELQNFIGETLPDVPLTYAGTISPGTARDRLATASALVLPSFGEVFPMTVLEALSVGTPVVLTRDCGISDEIKSSGAGIVTDGSPQQLAEAVEELLVNRQFWRDASDRGKRSVADTFSITAVAERLESVYLMAMR